jgi:cytochrome c-type biogenesis protein CcmE
MKPKNQRLVLGIAALVAVVGAGVLSLSALKDKASYFYAPTDLQRDHVADGQAIRLGGMVTVGSLKRDADGVTQRFVVHDDGGSVPVVFKGIAPDLFREGAGVVAEGAMEHGTFVATNLLAKHDERYMPPKQAGEMHETKTLAK